jgi:hypothetical protein
MDFMAVYGEAGMIGVVGVMFVYLVVPLSKKSERQLGKQTSRLPLLSFQLLRKLP